MNKPAISRLSTTDQNQPYLLPSYTGGTWLSVIIPVLNDADQMLDALLRLQEVRKHGAQIIVVDGNSSDDSATLAAPYADVVLHSQAQRAAQMNLGASHAQGVAFVFLNIGTRLPENAVLRIRSALKKRAWGHFDVRFEGQSVWLPWVARFKNWYSRASNIATADQAIFCTRELFAIVGGYSDLCSLEDVAFSKVARKLAQPACLNDLALVSARHWEQSGIVRCIVLTAWLRITYFLGISPNRFAPNKINPR